MAFQTTHQNFLIAFMLNMMEKVFVIVAGGEFIIGLLGNGFIGFTKCTAWIRTQKLYLVDLILTSLAWARFSQLWLIIVNISTEQFSQEVCDVTEYDQVFASIWILNNHLCIWFATCLAIFYLLKIANFSHRLFIWLKWRINKVIFILLVVSVPFLVITLPMPFSLGIFGYKDPSKHKRNLTQLSNVCKKNNLNYMLVFTIAYLPPFCLSLFSFLLLLISLQRHKKHIKLSVRDFRDGSLEAHIKAMKSIFCFLFLFSLYHLSLLLTFGAYYILHNRLISVFAYVLCLLYPSTHSYVVIFGNSQMKKDFFGIFSLLKDYLKRKFCHLYK